MKLFDRIRIVTSCWAADLPKDIVRVAICRGPPRRTRGYRRLWALAPGPWFSSASNEEFTELYGRQLAQLRPNDVYDRLVGLAGGAECVALMCFERPCTRDGWCHRAMVAQWLSHGLGIQVPEYGYEHLGVNEHPMQCAAFRHDADA